MGKPTPETLALALRCHGFLQIFARDVKDQIIFVLFLHCDLLGPEIHSLPRVEKAHTAQLA